MKKFLALLLTAVMMFSMSITALAAVPDTGVISPLWDNTMTAEVDLTFVGTTGYATAEVVGKTGTTAIKASVAVYKQIGEDEWERVDWTAGRTTTSLSYKPSVTFTGESGAYYKVVLNTTVTLGGVDETITEFAYGTCP